MKRVFPVKFFSQGKTCFHYRDPCNEKVFPCEKNFTGKALFSLKGWVCSADIYMDIP